MLRKLKPYANVIWECDVLKSEVAEGYENKQKTKDDNNRKSDSCCDHCHDVVAMRRKSTPHHVSATVKSSASHYRTIIVAPFAYLLAVMR